MKGVKGGATLEEIETVYRTQLAGLRRLAAAVSGSREAAFDLVQEAFVRAVRDRRSFRREAPIEAWLYRIVVNVARNHRRAERDRAGLPVEAGPHDNGSRHDDAGRVAAAVAPCRSASGSRSSSATTPTLTTKRSQRRSA
jgi:RNA polymerase sigma-70 factor, ECF subfamily